MSAADVLVVVAALAAPLATAFMLSWLVCMALDRLLPTPTRAQDNEGER